jgi:rhodanese-related sulfurtransferase
MINTLKSLFGMGTPVDFKELKSQGAILVDVRSKGEYSGGHIKGSVNIPLDVLTKNLDKLKSKETTIITCCASGMRSGSAKSILQSKGYVSVHNGGGWQSLQNKLK